MGELRGEGCVAFSIADRWQVTGDRWQATGDSWHVTDDILINFFFLIYFLELFLVSVLLSAHFERSVSPVLRIFLEAGFLYSFLVGGFFKILPSILRFDGTAHWCYCAGVLRYMDTQLLSFSLMGILQQGCSKISGVRRDRFIMTLPTIQGAQIKDHRPKKLWGKTMGEFGIFGDLEKLSKKLPKLWSEFNQKVSYIYST